MIWLSLNDVENIDVECRALDASIYQCDLFGREEIYKIKEKT